MGGLDSLSKLLWSPAYASLLLLLVAALVCLNRAIAPMGFRRVGIWRGAVGTTGLLAWIFVLALFNGGSEWIDAFLVASYFGIIAAALIFLPAATMLAQIGKYRFVWFVGAVLGCALVFILIAELVIGPEPIHGWNRWLSSLLPLIGLCGGGVVAFAIGARIPLQLHGAPGWR